MADESEIEDWRETFSSYDKSGAGMVQSVSVGEIMRVLGQNPTEEEVAKILKEIDPNGEKSISFEEFVPLMNIQKKKVRSKDDYNSFCEAFKMFDRENNGMANVAEVRNVLTSMGEHLSADEVLVLFEGLEDGNGQLNYEEFIRSIIEN